MCMQSPRGTLRSDPSTNSAGNSVIRKAQSKPDLVDGLGASLSNSGSAISTRPAKDAGKKLTSSSGSIPTTRTAKDSSKMLTASSGSIIISARAAVDAAGSKMTSSSSGSIPTRVMDSGSAISTRPAKDAGRKLTTSGSSPTSAASSTQKTLTFSAVARSRKEEVGESPVCPRPVAYGCRRLSAPAHGQEGHDDYAYSDDPDMGANGFDGRWRSTARGRGMTTRKEKYSTGSHTESESGKHRRKTRREQARLRRCVSSPALFAPRRPQSVTLDAQQIAGKHFPSRVSWPSFAAADRHIWASRAESILKGNLGDLWTNYLAKLQPNRRMSTDLRIMSILKEKMQSLDDTDDMLAYFMDNEVTDQSVLSSPNAEGRKGLKKSNGDPPEVLPSRADLLREEPAGEEETTPTEKEERGDRQEEVARVER
jgi:hypothetical protein